MRHRLVILIVAVLAVTGVAACGKDDEGAPAAVPPVTVPAPPLASGAAAASASAASAIDPGTAVPTTATTPGTPGTPAAPPAGPGATGGKPGERLTSYGIGPYEIGSSEKELKSAKLIGKVSTSNGCGAASGTNKHHAPQLTFAQGKLQRITVSDKAVTTAAGAKVGTTFAELQRFYPGGKQLSDWVGASGWMSTEGANALLFRIKDDKVTAMVAGLAGPVQVNFTDNQAC